VRAPEIGGATGSPCDIVHTTSRDPAPAVARKTVTLPPRVDRSAAARIGSNERVFHGP
jgi:hypothetical protein